MDELKRRILVVPPVVWCWMLGRGRQSGAGDEAGRQSGISAGAAVSR